MNNMKINSNDYATFYCNYETIKKFPTRGKSA